MTMASSTACRNVCARLLRVCFLPLNLGGYCWIDGVASVFFMGLAICGVNFEIPGPRDLVLC